MTQVLKIFIKKFPVKTSSNGDKIIDMNAEPTFSMSTYDPQKRSWYIGANKSYTEFARSGKLIPFWSDVYFSSSKNVPMISVSLPAIDKFSGRMLGIVGADYTVDHAQKLLAATKAKSFKEDSNDNVVMAISIKTSLGQNRI